MAQRDMIFIGPDKTFWKNNASGRNDVLTGDALMKGENK